MMTDLKKGDRVVYSNFRHNGLPGEVVDDGPHGGFDGLVRIGPDLKQGDRVVYAGDSKHNGRAGEVVDAGPYGIIIEFSNSCRYWCLSRNLIKEEKYNLMRLTGKVSGYD